VASAQSFTTLVNFSGVNGWQPGEGSFTVDQDGNLWGATQLGGTYNLGTVFEMTPTGTLTTVYNFGSTPGDSQMPYDPPVLGADGNFYGTDGGQFLGNGGIAYRLTPSGDLTVLYTFASSYGGYANWPSSSLTQGTDGCFYGVTYDFGYGTIFKIAPDGTYTLLHTFSGPDGRGPNAGLVQGTDGNFYGMAQWGGAYDEGGETGGAIFRISSTGNFTLLYSFVPPVGSPFGALIQAKDGNFYGTTGAGGSSYGTVFKMTPDGTVSTIYSFSGPDGSDPLCTLVQATDGNLYGTTWGGGAYSYGTIFRITTTGALTVLHNFDYTDGAGSASGLVQHPNGQFYGFTAQGGAYGGGTVYTFGGPLVSLSAPNLSFGIQQIGGLSAPQTVTLTNTGNATLSIASVSVNSNFFELSTTPTSCPYTGGTVAAGANCTIDVTFTPIGQAGLGMQSGSISITDNAASSPQSIVLSGTGTAPVAAVSTGSLTFGNQDLGTTSAPQAVALSNTGAAPLAINSVGISGDFAQTNNCGGSLGAGGSCTINVTFAPTAAGTRAGLLTITDNSNGMNGSQQVVSLSGTGANPGVSLSSTSLAFGPVVVNTSSTAMRVLLTSAGTTNLNISSLAITGANAGDFAQTNNCPPSMAPGTNCILYVTFTPSTLAAESATLNVNDSAVGSPQTVALSGTGGAAAVLSPASGTFGTVAIGVPSSSRNLILQNNQSVALGISSITLSNPDFTETNTCGSSLAAKGSCTISVTLTPSVLALETATLTVNDNAAAPYNALSSSLSGTGIAQTTVGPTSLTFAPQSVGTSSAPMTVTLKNNLLQPLAFSSITITGADPADFTQTNTCGSSVPANSGCVVSVTFTPTATGTRTATLNLNDAANNSPQTISLTGTGK
jgi:uncharacterized repeat protein (TIGR03803 family)